MTVGRGRWPVVHVAPQEPLPGQFIPDSKRLSWAPGTAPTCRRALAGCSVFQHGLELPRYDGHLSIGSNQGGESWREEGEGGIRPSTGSGSSSLRERVAVRGLWPREFEPSEQTIRNWVRQAELDEGLRSDGMTTAAREEVKELKRENRRLRMERDILEKAAAWFARESGSIPGGGMRS